MCVVSNVFDNYGERWGTPRPAPAPFTTSPNSWPPLSLQPDRDAIKKVIEAEMEQFKKDVLEALEIDKREGNPDCGSEAKRLALVTLANEYGVDLDEVIESLAHLELE